VLTYDDVSVIQPRCLRCTVATAIGDSRLLFVVVIDVVDDGIMVAITARLKNSRKQQSIGGDRMESDCVQATTQ